MSDGIAPISAHIGAAVTGLDLNTVTGSMPAQLHEALARYVVLVFRDQKLEPPDLLDAVRMFGEPERQNYSQFNHPDFLDIGILDHEGKQTPADMWHTDSTNRECPPKANALYALAVPSRGGDTNFANMRSAYASLPEETGRQLDGLRTVNSFDGQRGAGRGPEGFRTTCRPSACAHAPGDRRQGIVYPHLEGLAHHRQNTGGKPALP